MLLDPEEASPTKPLILVPSALIVALLEHLFIVHEEISPSISPAIPPI